MESDGELLAEIHRPLVPFETTLPVRYPLPPEDVRVELLDGELQERPITPRS